MGKEERVTKSRNGEREKTVQGLLLYWTSEGASGEWGLGVRDNGQRQRKETDRLERDGDADTSLCEGGNPQGPSQCLVQGHTRHNPSTPHSLVYKLLLTFQVTGCVS